MGISFRRLGQICGWKLWDTIFYFPQGFAGDGVSWEEGIKLTLQVLKVEKYLHNELSFIYKDGATLTHFLVDFPKEKGGLIIGPRNTSADP